MTADTHVLAAELREFLDFFQLQVPSGVTARGIARFQEAYLRDPDRQAQWQEHLLRRSGGRELPATGPASAPMATAAPTARPLRFTGNGGEYFRIWVVNMLLTLLTLGIYSAWAKVRRTRYFYRNTVVGGSGLDYHGDPVVILKGRLIGLGLFLAYNFSFDVSLTIGFATLALLLAVLPLLLRNSFRFRLANTSYRGLRFSFRGSLGEAYRVFAGFGSLAFVIGLFWPLFHHRLKMYQHNHSYFGQAKSTFDGTYREFSTVYASAIGLMLLAVMAAGVAAAVLGPAAGKGGGEAAGMAITGIVFGIVGLAVFFIQPYLGARLQNLIWNHTRLGPVRFESRVQVRRLMAIQFTNFVLVVLTLGFYWPWAAVRAARYRVESVEVIADEGFDSFVADAAANADATGEGAADIFDIEIAL